MMGPWTESRRHRVLYRRHCVVRGYQQQLVSYVESLTGRVRCRSRRPMRPSGPEPGRTATSDRSGLLQRAQSVGFGGQCDADIGLFARLCRDFGAVPRQSTGSNSAAAIPTRAIWTLPTVRSTRSRRQHFAARARWAINVGLAAHRRPPTTPRRRTILHRRSGSGDVNIYALGM